MGKSRYRIILRHVNYTCKHCCEIDPSIIQLSIHFYCYLFYINKNQKVIFYTRENRSNNRNTAGLKSNIDLHLYLSLFFGVIFHDIPVSFNVVWYCCYRVCLSLKKAPT